jgi:hypothetical protein
MRGAPDPGARRVATWVRSNVPSDAISSISGRGRGSKPPERALIASGTPPGE